jgi:hypothetical protein
MWKKPNCNDQTFHAKARLTGHALFNHFGRVFFFLLRADKRVSHHGLAIYIQKYLKAKQDLWKLKYFTMQNIIYKKSSTRNQIAFRYYNSKTNFKFQHKPKYHISNHIKIGLLLPRAKIP